MPQDKHTDDLKNVNEGDRVEITTTEGKNITVDCIRRCVQRADPRNGKIRETEIWTFQAHGMDGAVTLYASILNGHKPDLPRHSSVWNEDAEVNLGYITDVQIEGQPVES